MINCGSMGPFRCMQKSAIGRYGMALLATLTALTLRELLRPLLGNTNPYHTIWAVIVFSAWYCGMGPSIVASLFGALGVWYLFLAPYHSFALQNRTDIFGIVDFLLLSGFIMALGEGIRRGEAKRKKAEHELQIAREMAYDKLDHLVKEQTSELERSNQQLRQLSARLIRIQDEERRRIARELHDSAGQYLAAVAMALEAAKHEQASAKAIRKLDEAAEITKVCSSEIRTISHLLHPPLLEEMGLAPAIRWYVEGFVARSGIRVSIDLAEEFDRLGNDAELALFRVLQESLTNIHRHSGSTTATVRVRADSGQVLLEIEDQGRGRGEDNGSSSRSGPGIGTLGMRERLNELAGVLEIASDESGTRVRAVIPAGAGARNIKIGEKAASAAD